MIEQEIKLLKADTKRQRIAIQEQIVGYYINSYNMIATQAAVLAGFAFSAFSFHDSWDWLDPLHRCIFVNFSTASTTCNIAAVVIATHCSIQAPGLCLLGPDGSTSKACKLLKRWHGYTMAAHNLGLLFFVASLCDIGFMQFNVLNTVCLNIQCILGLIWITYCVMQIKQEFTFHTGMQLDGSMSFRQDQDDFNVDTFDMDMGYGNSDDSSSAYVAIEEKPKQPRASKWRGNSRRGSGAQRRSPDYTPPAVSSSGPDAWTSGAGGGGSDTGMEMGEMPHTSGSSEMESSLADQIERTSNVGAEKRMPASKGSKIQAKSDVASGDKKKKKKGLFTNSRIR